MAYYVHMHMKKDRHTEGEGDEKEMLLDCEIQFKKRVNYCYYLSYQ